MLAISAGSFGGSGPNNTFMTTAMLSCVVRAVLAFAAIVLLIKFLRKSSIIFCMTAIWLIYPVLGWVTAAINSVMNAETLSQNLPGVSLLPLCANIVITGYLLLSERVERVYGLHTP